MNKVFETQEFTKIASSFDKNVQEWIESVKDQISENIYVGKPIRFDWFREKKLKNLRLYFIAREEKALLIALGNKKEQQEIIDSILKHKKEYLEEISALF